MVLRDEDTGLDLDQQDSNLDSISLDSVSMT